jgi:hypothetical protein
VKYNINIVTYQYLTQKKLNGNKYNYIMKDEFTLAFINYNNKTVYYDENTCKDFSRRQHITFLNLPGCINHGSRKALPE